MNPATTVKGWAPWIRNPALLVASESDTWSLDLASIDASISNNTLDFYLYEKYNGAFLTESDSFDILNRIPGSGAKLALRASSGLFAFRHGNLGFCARSYVGGHGVIDKEFVEFLFYGNVIDRSYRFLNSGSFLAYTSWGFSGGTPVGEFARWDVALGGSVRYIMGHYAAEVMDSRGETVTGITGIDGWGEILLRRSKGTGNSIGADIGLWGTLDCWEVRLAVLDVGLDISWSSAEDEYISYQFEDWTFIEEVRDEGHAFDEDRTTRSVNPTWNTSLPTRLHMLVAYHTDWGQTHLLWEQGFCSIAGTAITPRIALGNEWVASSWLRPRLQIGFGSPESLSLAAGLGMDIKYCHLDLAITNFLLPPMISRGFGLTARIGFE